MSQRLNRVRNAAGQRKKVKFTALLHHIDFDLLLESFLALKRSAAAGVDSLNRHVHFQVCVIDKLLMDLLLFAEGVATPPTLTHNGAA